VNRAYEKYKEALEELPKIEKQIEQIMKLKRRISIEKVSGLQLLLKANAEEKPKVYNDEEKEIYSGLSMFSPLSFSPFGRSREEVLMFTETEIKLPKPIYLEVIQDNSPRMRVGTKAKIDRIASKVNCGSGIMMRVINIYKKPTWFDSGWFKC